jgi:hypothetical protein
MDGALQVKDREGRSSKPEEVWAGRLQGVKGLRTAAMPRFLEWLPLMGVAIVWASVGLGGGELQQWPYLVMRYRGAFIGLILPALIMQFWVNQEIARYTLLTGEGIWMGFSRLNRVYFWVLVVAMLLSWTLFGAYIGRGSDALAGLTHLPSGLTASQQATFWSYMIVLVCALGLFLYRRPYMLIEGVSYVFLALALGSMVLVVSQPEVIHSGETFFKAFFNPLKANWPATWDPADATRLGSALALAGLGGFFNLMLSYWLKERGAGMAGLRRSLGQTEAGTVDDTLAGYRFEDTPDNRRHYRRWFGATRMANMGAICLCAVGLLLPAWVGWAEAQQSPVWDGTKVLEDYLKYTWGTTGIMVFFVAMGAYLLDTWLIMADGWARSLSDIVRSQFSWATRWSEHRWYQIFLGVTLFITFLTLIFKNIADQLISIQGLMQLFGFALFCPGLIYLNFVLLPRHYPSWTHPRLGTRVIMIAVTLIYWGIALWYFMALRG